MLFLCLLNDRIDRLQLLLLLTSLSWQKDAVNSRNFSFCPIGSKVPKKCKLAFKHFYTFRFFVILKTAFFFLNFESEKKDHYYTNAVYLQSKFPSPGRFLLLFAKTEEFLRISTHPLPIKWSLKNFLKIFQKTVDTFFDWVYYLGIVELRMPLKTL
jgi:hypothetical protein